MSCLVTRLSVRLKSCPHSTRPCWLMIRTYTKQAALPMACSPPVEFGFVKSGSAYMVMMKITKSALPSPDPLSLNSHLTPLLASPLPLKCAHHRSHGPTCPPLGQNRDLPMTKSQLTKQDDCLDNNKIQLGLHLAVLMVSNTVDAHFNNRIKKSLQQTNDTQTKSYDISFLTNVTSSILKLFI